MDAENVSITPGLVLAPRLGAVRVLLPDGRKIQALNGLHARIPPGSRVLIAVDDAGEHSIIGWKRN